MEEVKGKPARKYRSKAVVVKILAVSVTNAQKISYMRQGITAETKPVQHPGR